MNLRKGITVAELGLACQDLCNKGLGNKHILVSDDDEGNGFHTLFYTFLTDQNEINEWADMFHDYNDPDEVVLLG